jgi:glutathione S-transferase
MLWRDVGQELHHRANPRRAQQVAMHDKQQLEREHLLRAQQAHEIFFAIRHPAGQDRGPGSPYYGINPSGRVPYLIDDSGAGMEDSQLICAYLDALDGHPRFHGAPHASDLAYRGLEFAARSMCDGIAVWGREMVRPENERSPTTLAHETARAQRMADFFEGRVSDPLMQGTPGIARLILAVAVEMAKSAGWAISRRAVRSSRPGWAPDVRSPVDATNGPALAP